MTTFRSALLDTATSLLHTGRPTVTEIVTQAIHDHESLFFDHAEEYATQQAHRMVKEYLRSLDDEDDGQDSLPGIKGLPRAISVGGEYYVSAERATWPELLAGRESRVGNIASAQHRLDAYDAALDRLRPVMEGTTTVTVASAMKTAVATPAT